MTEAAKASRRPVHGWGGDHAEATAAGAAANWALSRRIGKLRLLALVPLLGGAAVLFGGLWQHRQRLDATLNRRPWLARAAMFGAGVGLGLLVAPVFAYLWWSAVGAGLLTAARALLALQESWLR